MTSTQGLGRTIAIGDVHGCLAALDTILEAVGPTTDDVVITLGDYVDRGPDSRGVIDRLLELRTNCQLIPLLGNHDAQMLAAVNDPHELERWLAFGGIATLYSYSPGLRIDQISEDHLEFLRGCRRFHETASHLFIHANYRENLPLADQDDDVLLWLSLKNVVPGPHYSGKRAVVGHTAQRSYEILDLNYLVCIDTGCCYGGWLTAFDVQSGEIWQADKQGRLRTLDANS